MIEDARTLPERSVLRADICIVGAGAAGITLARHHIGRRTSVLLIESGDFDPNEDTQALYGGTVSQGLFDLELSRLRYFGGSTNHWGGVCRPLDADDFQVRDWVPHSGWPITLADLQPYYARACEIVELSSKQWDNKSWQDKLAGFFRLPFMGERIAGAVFQLSPPTHFGEVYRDALAGASNVRTLLNANVVDIATDPNAARVTGLQLACLNGPRFKVEARVYVLAAGAVENPRLLLNANNVQAPGLGNGRDLVGRFYMNHPGFYGADILLSKPEESLVKPIGATHTILPRLVVTPQEARRERLGKFSAWVHNVDETGNLEVSNGYRAMRALFRNLSQGNFSGALLDELTQLLGDLDGAARGVLGRFRPAQNGSARSGVGAHAQSRQPGDPDRRARRPGASSRRRRLAAERAGHPYRQTQPGDRR